LQLKTVLIFYKFLFSKSTKQIENKNNKENLAILVNLFKEANVYFLHSQLSHHFLQDVLIEDLCSGQNPIDLIFGVENKMNA
jgi:hypothetical protein